MFASSLLRWCSVKREYTTTHVEIGSNYAGIFTDRNALQLTAADRMGIAPQEDEANIAGFVKEGKLVMLNSCRYYISTASMPYLTPEAADLLAEGAEGIRRNWVPCSKCRS